MAHAVRLFSLRVSGERENGGKLQRSIDGRKGDATARAENVGRRMNCRKRKAQWKKCVEYLKVSVVFINRRKHCTR